MAGDLVRRAPVPRLGLEQARLDAIGPDEADEEVEAALQLAPPGAGCGIESGTLQGEGQEARHAGLVEGGGIAGSWMAGASLDGVVRDAPVGPRQRVEDRGPLAHRQLEDLMTGQCVGLRDAREGPGLLGGDPLVEHAVAQVRLRSQHGRADEGLALLGLEAVPEGLHDLRQGIAARTSVDHGVRAVVGVVSSRPEGEAGALPLALEARDHAPSLLPCDLEERLVVGFGVVTRQGAGEHRGPRTLARVLDPVEGADDGALPVAMGQHPAQHPVEGLGQGGPDRDRLERARHWRRKRPHARRSGSAGSAEPPRSRRTSPLRRWSARAQDVHSLTSGTARSPKCLRW